MWRNDICLRADMAPRICEVRCAVLQAVYPNPWRLPPLSPRFTIVLRRRPHPPVEQGTFTEERNANIDQMEVEVVRTKITLACTECKQRNYNLTKDKKTHPDRMEVKKYCRFCRKHTLHKETR